MMTLWLVVILALVVLVFLTLALLPVILRATTAMRQASRVTNSPERSAEATVLGKRIELPAIEGGRTGQRHFATFQLASGERIELELTGHQFGLLAEADQGTLRWKGPRYLDFDREILR